MTMRRRTKPTPQDSPDELTPDDVISRLLAYPAGAHLVCRLAALRGAPDPAIRMSLEGSQPSGWEALERYRIVDTAAVRSTQPPTSHAAVPASAGTGNGSSWQGTFVIVTARTRAVIRAAHDLQDPRIPLTDEQQARLEATLRTW